MRRLRVPRVLMRSTVVVGDKKPIRDVIEMLSAEGLERLRRYAATKRVSAHR